MLGARGEEGVSLGRDMPASGLIGPPQERVRGHDPTASAKGANALLYEVGVVGGRSSGFGARVWGLVIWGFGLRVWCLGLRV